MRFRSDAVEFQQGKTPLRLRRSAAMRVELRRLNKDLQLFAYAVSHDLQEPLRMVVSYTQLLARDYKDRPFDERADQYMAYAVEGAQRMEDLLRGMREFLGGRGKLGGTARNHRLQSGSEDRPGEPRSCDSGERP